MATQHYDLIVVDTAVATQLRVAKLKVVIRTASSSATSVSCMAAYLLGQKMYELITLFAFAIRHRHTVQELKDTVFAYPTGASDIASML